MIELAIKKSIQAFLLSGMHGIGKTTIARIIANTLICLNSNICGECNACKNKVDIIEIDGATYTGVDKVREIIEQSTFRPLISNRKVFIIDEAHMLSKSAFNALLKTLEEPSSFSYFIFATTEINRIPKTVASRCLVCNLQPLSIEEIKIYLKQEIQDYEYEEEILTNIARKAHGSIRDAKFILQKLFLILETKKITFNDLKVIFSYTDQDINEIITALANSDAQSAISIVDQIEADPKFLLQDIAHAIYQSDLVHKIELYNIAINTLYLLKHFNHMEVVKVAILKMCSKISDIDQIVSKAKELFPDLQFIE